LKLNNQKTTYKIIQINRERNSLFRNMYNLKNTLYLSVTFPCQHKLNKLGNNTARVGKQKPKIWLFKILSVRGKTSKTHQEKKEKTKAFSFLHKIVTGD
jgi:hypothetical protein